ncbi:MAG: LCCL domain-containing protein [Deltaproteobacteria bacterium]|nr:LCCL domain-containing protein [Deltaproteobacteria bacterium]
MTTTTTKLAAAALFTLALGACSKPPPCGPRFDAGVAECSCAGVGSGSVWGSGIYTTDSPVCSAAVHAGAIPAGGGTIKPKPAPGCGAYVGSTANGVTTSNWGSFGSSFVFPGHGDGKCAAAPAGGVAPPARAGVAQGGACPRTIGEFADAATAAEFNCTCGAGAGGSVYGTGVYTTDSSLCAAAVHAGAAPAAGGPVTAKKTGGCAKYTGTTANGVTTTSWGAYGSSFFFGGHGDGKCAN